MASQWDGSDKHWMGSWCTGYNGFTVCKLEVRNEGSATCNVQKLASSCRLSSFFGTVKFWDCVLPVAISNDLNLHI